MKTLITIMAHSAAQDTFERHYPIWREHKREGAELLFIFPEGNAIRGLGEAYLELGRPEHDGKQAILRFRSVVNHLAGLIEIQRHVFMEYDSFIMGSLPKLDGDFAGNIFTDDAPEWIGKSFIHPPFMCDGNAMSKIAAQFATFPMDIEKGMWDRALGLATEKAGLTRKSWITNGYGFSRNTVEKAEYETMHAAIVQGAHALHGIKTEECFKVVMGAWNLRRQMDVVEAAGFSITRK
jgi:hypothetical protein